MEEDNEDISKEIFNTLGLGDLPILDQRNRSLHDELVSLQIQNIRDKSKNERERERILEIHTHIRNVSESLQQITENKISRETELESEKNLVVLNSSFNKRLIKDLENVQEETNRVSHNLETLNNDIEGRKVVLELLENEFESESNCLMNESSDIFEKEDNFIKFLKYQNEDELRIKETHLRMEKYKDNVERQKEALQKAATENRMKQLEMNRTVDSFRSLHKERQEIRAKWKSALDVIKVRDVEIERIYQATNDKSEELRQCEIENKERLVFFDNENRNISELEGEIRTLERRNQGLESDLDKYENELDDIDCAIGLEKRETARIGLQIEKKRSELKECKTDYNKRIQKVEKIKSEIEEMRSRKVHSRDLATTADDRSKEADILLDVEMRHYDSLKFQIDKMRLKKLNKENELKQNEEEAVTLEMEIKGLKSQKTKLVKDLKHLKEEVAKKEETNLKSSHDLASIENEIARIKGENLSTEEKNKRKQETILLKKELESKKVEKINLDRLLHKMESEVKKLNREITQIDKEKITTQVKLEEIELIINKCKVKNKSLQDQVESLLLEEQLMKVAETKSRSEVETASNELAEMGKENIQIENDIRERREELQARKDVLLAQDKSTKEDLSNLKIKTKEREDRSIKLNTRYECLLKSLGDVRKLDGDEVPSHAYHILKLAQKKAELRDEAAEMGCKISKKEKDLKELEATLNSLRDSNSNYRGNVTTTLKGSPSQEEEISLLEGQISKKKDEIASLHSEICELEKDIRLKKERISEFELRLERSKRIYDNKIHVLRTAEKELLSQNEKYERAFKLKSKIGKKFYEKNISTLGGLSYQELEMEMNLRIERDKQRMSLIRAREMCRIDDLFGKEFTEELNKLSLTMPTLSRLEESSLSSSKGLSKRRTRTSSISRTYNHSDISLYRRSTSESRNANTNVLVMKLDATPCKNSRGIATVR